MNKGLLVILGIVIVALLVGGTLYMRKGTPAPQGLPDKLTIETPLANTVVTSPLTVKGQARGTWFFEASFPVKVLDADKKELGAGVAHAQGEWMTENFVPFEATIEFTKGAAKNGFIIVAKDNPSGLPENDASFELPVKFE